MRPQAESNDNTLSYDVIIATSGFKYRDYNTAMSRTLFIDPTNEQKLCYTKLYELHNKLKDSMKPGTKINDVYKIGVDFINEKLPNIKNSIPAHFGFGMGLEYRESNLLINAKNEREF